MPVTDPTIYNEPYDPSGLPPPKPKPAPTVLGSAAPAQNPNNPNNPPLPPLPPPPPPAPVQPISLQGGQVSYNPTTAPFGFDQSAPGTREQFWNNNQGMWFDSPSLDWVDSQIQQFQDPWAGENSIQSGMGQPQPNNMGDYWAGVQGSMNTPTGAEKTVAGGYHDPNLAKAAFGQTQSRIPGSFQPGFDAYYDRMKQKVMSDVNSQSAARGAYGSNTALNGSIGAGLDVEAQRAKAATDFMFKDSENQRAWLAEAAAQARAADQSGIEGYNANIEGSRYGLDKIKTLGDLAFKADDSDLNRDKFNVETAKTLDELKRNRLDSGISTALGSNQAHGYQLENAFRAAGAAQDSRENRINTLHNQLSSFTNDVQDFVTDYYDQLIDSDGNINEQQLQTLIAQAADERGWDQHQQERIMRDAETAIKLITGKKEDAVAKGGTG